VGQIAGVHLPWAVRKLVEGSQAIEDGAGFRREDSESLGGSHADGRGSLRSGGQGEGQKGNGEKECGKG
jgi:hypothetical protein